MRDERLQPVIRGRVGRHHACEPHRPVVAAAGCARELAPLARHCGVVDLRDRAAVAHTRGDEERLPHVPDAVHHATVERAVVVEQVTDARARVAAVEVARPPKRPVPRRLDVVGRRGDDVAAQAVRAEKVLKRHCLAGPPTTGLVRARHMRVVVARPASEADLQVRPAMQTADVPAGIAEQAARDRFVSGEAVGEEHRAVRVAVVPRPTEVENDDSADAATCCAAALPSKHVCARRVLVEGDRRAQTDARLRLRFAEVRARRVHRNDEPDDWPHAMRLDQ